MLELTIVEDVNYYNKRIKAKLKGLSPVQYRTQSWTWYNKVDIKLSGKDETIMPRKTFDKAFKLAAVKLILEEKQPVKTVSSTLGVYPNR